MKRSLNRITDLFAFVTIALIGSVIQDVRKQVTPDPVPFGAFAAGHTWRLDFRDEFTGTAIDLNKWSPHWFGTLPYTEPINVLEHNCYNPANVRVSGGELILTATTNMTSQCQTLNNTMADYQSGVISSNGHYNFTYGYIEARILHPAGIYNESVWGQFWTLNPNWPQGGEIDVVECYGTDESCSAHYHFSGGAPGINSTVPGSTTGYHIYAAYWQPGKITWFYDGIKVWEYTTGIVSVPHYIVAALATIGDRVITPAVMKVDYIRVWKLADGTPTPPVKSVRTNTPALTATRLTPAVTGTAQPTKSR